MSQRLQFLKCLQEVNLSPEEAEGLLERLQTDRKTQEGEHGEDKQEGYGVSVVGNSATSVKFYTLPCQA